MGDGNTSMRNGQYRVHGGNGERTISASPSSTSFSAPSFELQISAERSETVFPFFLKAKEANFSQTERDSLSTLPKSQRGKFLGRDRKNFKESIRYRVTPVAMMGVENTPTPMNPTIKSLCSASSASLENRSFPGCFFLRVSVRRRTDQSSG